MIYTLTLNPAVDYYIEMNNFEEGELNKVNNAYTLAGGKGINVSKVLKNFDIDSTALGFCGGFTGKYIKEYLKEYGIKENFIDLKDDTRINIKLKTNKKELGEYFNKKIETLEDIIMYAKELIKDGSENVIVSLGKDGSILTTKDEVYIGNAPYDKLISSVGAGDSMIAGIVYGISKKLNIVDSYKYAIASGSSTACSKGLTTFENMNIFLEKIEIKKIN